MFLDTPYQKTYLTSYYRTLEKNRRNRKLALSSRYKKMDIDIERFIEFAINLGVERELSATEQKIPWDHPEHNYLVVKALGKNTNYNSIDKDYTIPDLKYLIDAIAVLEPLGVVPDALFENALENAQSIWHIMCTQPHERLTAKFRKNSQYAPRTGKSTLVHVLKDTSWVPQETDGESPVFVRPCEAVKNSLPKGFPWPKGHPEDAGDKWLEAVDFGNNAIAEKTQRAHRDQHAQAFGFNSSEEAEKAAELAKLLQHDPQQTTMDDLISEHKSRSRSHKPDFPTASVRNPELRGARVRADYKDAPEKTYEKREISKRMSKNEINPRTLLKEWYTNEFDVMVCQICKDEMPFKKIDGEYYFVAVEFLTTRALNDEHRENHLLKEYEQQYLALCPECAARYKYFVGEIRAGTDTVEKLKKELRTSESLEVPIRLGEWETTIRFVETHLHDLKAILQAREDTTDTTD